MRTTLLWLALGLGAASVAYAAAVPADQRAVPVFRSHVKPGETTIVAQPASLAVGTGDLATSWRQSAVLPPDAASWCVTVTSVEGEREVEAELLGRLRGLPVVTWIVEDADVGAVTRITHDGNWDASADAVRLASRGFDAAVAAALPGWTAPPSPSGHGTYVVVTTPEFVAAIEPLLAWKRQKGLPTYLATTAETGATNVSIQAWLRNAYVSWEAPPEYVLIVGDVEHIPSWNFSENVTDLPYTHLNEGDWLPDVMLGRFPVADALEVQAIVHKTVAYEKAPYREDEGWLTRQLMVGGNYGSTTPTHTVKWVGEQLESLGFDPAVEVLFPPFWNGITPVTMSLEQGVGMCVYRGWAYGTAGWEPPHFTVDEIPNVNNGAMTPILMSFVCLNGDFAAPEPCFGEVFLRQGTPTEAKGIVAFIGNGEHWSHTRYNDAMAIAYFETYPDPGITDLGMLTLAGRLRFMAYFPHEMSAAEYGEESVEFYFHIYNLLGDPELNMWKGAPRDLTVDYPVDLSAQARRLDVTVREDDGVTAVADAQVGVVADGEIVGSARTDLNGLAVVEIEGWNDGGDLTVTVTRPDRFAHVGIVSVEVADHFVEVTDLVVFNPGDTVDPGEILTVRPELTNTGAMAVGTVDLTLTVRGPATVTDSFLSVPGIAADDSYQCSGDEAVSLQIEIDAEDGDVVELLFAAVHDGTEDVSMVSWTVAAPSLSVSMFVADGDNVVDPGEISELTMTLTNAGSLPTTGGSLTAELLTPGVGTLSADAVDFGPVAPGGSVVGESFLTLDVHAGVPVGTGLTLRLTVTTDEGLARTSLISTIVGSPDAGAPVGPDAYGYRALDSADLDYPALAPVYRWRELDTDLGGDGVEVPFAFDNEVVLIDLPFDFTFYGRTYGDQIRLSENGWISFDTNDEYEFYNWPIPNSHGNHSMVCAFWDNFDPTLAGTGGVFTRYDDQAGTLTVEWSAMRHYRPEVVDAQTFQLVLFDPAVHPTTTGDGDILFLYRQVLNTDSARQYATIGLEDPTETDGLQLSYANINRPGMAPVGPGLAVLLTTEIPVRVPYEVDTFRAERRDGGVVLTWSVSDLRPVVGWRPMRQTSGGFEAVTDVLLDSGVREYVDHDAPAETVLSYRLDAIHPYGHVNRAGITVVDGTTDVRPVRFALHPVRPNPSSGRTDLAFALPQGGPASLRVYDAAGRLVRTLLAGEVPAGPGHTVWDGRDGSGRDAGAGVYFFRLESGGRVETRKLLLVR